MPKQKTIEQEINEFLEVWGCDQMISFLRDITPLFELYDVDEENDWLKEAIGDSESGTIRLIQTVYLISKISKNHASKLAYLNIHFKDLSKQMESINTGNTDE